MSDLEITSKLNLPFKLNLTQEQKELIYIRYNEFQNFSTKTNAQWFSELCFCILTANSQAKRAIAIQEKLGHSGFLEKPLEEIASTIKSFGHRFHNNKAKYIIQAREFANIKDRLKNFDDFTAREYIVKNIKGIGYKEASHFLRNVGYSQVAIIDRHILKFLLEQKLIPEIPKTITTKHYLKFEKILQNFSSNQSILDLMIWCHMTGEVLK